MAHGDPQPLGRRKHRDSVKDQTSPLMVTPIPGSTGGSSGEFWPFLHSAGRYFSDHAKSTGHYVLGHAKSLLLTIIDLVPFKPDAPFSLAFLKHYVEGSGEPFHIDSVPDDWQVWIVKATKARVGYYKDIDPYNSGIYDLVNSMGHFNVKVATNKDGLTKFEITDVYEFGFTKNDRKQLGRHGFPLGDLSDTEISLMRSILPSEVYRNPGGFKERWEIKKVGKHTILFIPQQVLAEEGTPFAVSGSFVRDAEKTMKAHTHSPGNRSSTERRN